MQQREAAIKKETDELAAVVLPAGKAAFTP